MKNPFTEIMDTYEILKEMTDDVAASLAAGGSISPMSSGLLGSFPPKDREKALREYINNFDDLIVASIFAAFESHFRDFAFRELSPVVPSSSSSTFPLLIQWLEDKVEKDAFFKLIEKFEGTVSAFDPRKPQLWQDMHQIRIFRNWVSHGKPQKKPKGWVQVTPQAAKSTLTDVLKAVGAL